jgi:hypothetical protein
MTTSWKTLRIFLSYGHDANEELVRRIKADLENRGHDVWSDRNQIKFGDDWRRAITDGILQSNRVLSFLSKHSTRDATVEEATAFVGLILSAPSECLSSPPRNPLWQSKCSSC